jgi:glycosyltransferase involved in cell wall biosynthesis
MRVAHVITRLIVGGAQENTLWTVDDQHHVHGDDVCLITGPGRGPEGSLEPLAQARGLDLKIVPPFHRNISPLNEVAAYRAVIRLLRQYRPDVVHTHSSKAGIIGRLAAHRLGIPAVHTVHGAAFHFGQSAVAFRLYRSLERKAANWCDQFITVCDAMTQQYLAAGIATPDRYTTIYSGMDVDRLLQPQRSREDIRASLEIEPDDLVVGKIARLFNLKGHQYLIEAAKRVVADVPRIKFLLLGDGNLRGRFEARIAELGLSRHFIFAGLIPPSDVPDYVHAMDIVAHTSEWEGLPRVLPQALIAGKPIVSFEIDGAPEVCIPNETGILVPPRDVDALARALTKLASDGPLRDRLGRNGRDRFTNVFRHQTMTERIREVYAQVLR